MSVHTNPWIVGQPLTPDLEEARRHLAALDPTTQTFCFQTFDDNQKRDDPTLARTIHGSLDARAQELIDLNNRGAGVFVTVNEVKPGKRRITKNIMRARALFVDADDPQKIDQVQSGVHRFGVPTSIITETSPFKYHLYWLTSDFPLDQFKAAQQALVEIFETDAHPVDLPRVLRLAGFIHGKETPWRSMLHQAEPDRVYPSSVLLGRIQACNAMAAPNSNVVALQPRGEAGKPIPGIQPALSAARKSTANTAAQSGIVSPHWFDKLLPKQKNDLLRAIAEHPEFIKLADQTKNPWLKPFFGFKDAEGRGATEAKGIALAWCKTSPRFVSDANFTKDWNSHDRKRKNPIAVGTLLDAAQKAGVDLQPWRDKATTVVVVWDAPAANPRLSLADFYAYLPMHKYIFVPSRALWPLESVNSQFPPIKLKDANDQPVLNKRGEQVALSAGAWLDRFQPIQQMTWAPGLPLIIRDKLILDGGWIARRGVQCFNLYQSPIIEKGDPSQAGKWLDHLRYVYPDGAEHILDWLAHRVQRPQEKINHALVLGGAAGIGKDTILEPVKYAVGPWNFQEVTPQKILDKYSGYLKSVILRINEARDLGEFDRFQFYEHTKIYMASPPDVLPISEKYIR